MSFRVFLLICFLPAIWCAKLDLVLLKDPTALCLDGSPGAYYIQRGTDPINFVLYFQGGGWCGDKDLPSTIQNCYQRSMTRLGSSRNYPKSIILSDGIISDHENNQFKSFTRIFLRYCDGSGHQGTRTQPVVYKNTKLYFRGNNITVAQLEDIEAREGLFSKGKKIIVTGTSAGGLAAFQWADYIREKAPNSQVYSVPDSGIFLDSETFDTHQSSYSKQFENLFQLSNAEMSPPVSECVKKYSKQQHKCMMVQYLAQFIKTPTFVVQPLYDTWSIYNILNINCLQGSSLTACSRAERDFIQQYHKNTTEVLLKISKNNANSVWAPACATHGFIHTQAYYSQSYRIPMSSSNSIDSSLMNWIEKKSKLRVLIDQGHWPMNKPCSGIGI